MSPISVALYGASMGLAFVVVTLGSPTLRVAASSAAALGAAAAVAVGVRRHVTKRHLPWAILVGGLALVGAGHALLWARLHLWQSAPTEVSVADMLTLAGFLAWLVAYVALGRTAGVPHDRSLLLDTGVVVAGVAAPLHVLVFEPIFDATGMASGTRALLLTRAVLDVAMLVVLHRLLFGRARRTPAVVMLAAGMGVVAVADLVSVGLAANGLTDLLTYVAVASVPAYALIGGAALHYSAGDRQGLATKGPPLVGWPRVLTVGVAVLLPSATASVVDSTGRELDWFHLLVPSIALGTLVVARLRSSAADLARRDAYFRALVSNISDVVVVSDAKGVMLDVTAAEEWSRPEASNERLAAMLPEALAAKGGPVVGQVRLGRGNEMREYEVTARDMRHVDAVRGVLWVFRDITERTFFEQELVRQALHDALTGLPNRVLFADRLEHARARRGSGGVAVLYIDLDDFKAVNDSLGHDAGDALLRTVASRFGSVLRDEDTVARLGGDEFAVLVELDSPDDDGSHIAGRLLDALQEPVEVAGQRVAVTASIGVAVATGRDDVDTLGQADIAMYQAKGEGKNVVAVFHEGMQTVASERLQLAMELVDALEGGQLRVAYQPIIDLGDGAIVGVEALLRWAHPTRGMVPPLDFIPTAEENGLIVPIGRFVLNEACKQATQWAGETGAPMKLSVNLSARQLESDVLVDDVRDALAASGLAPEHLVLELTESMLVRNVERSVARLLELKALGVRLAIDDFGTGYSSLSYLRQFPIDVLKIDRSFVASMVSSEEAGAVVRALVDMGRALKLETLAEGVEEEDQADLLRAERCDFAQGFLFAAPMPAARIGELLAHGSGRGANAEV